MTLTKAEIATNRVRFNFAIKEIKRRTNKVATALNEENLQLLCKLKSELIDLECEVKELYFGVSDDENEEFYNNYVEAKDIACDDLVKIEQFLKSRNDILEPGNSSIHNTSETSLKCNNLKLPKFDLPVFYGDISTWVTFKETFITAIDNNESLSDQLKFSYLLASVKSYPAKLISGFSISGDNYKQAWETLVNRYDDRKGLAYALLGKFINAKSLKSPTQKAILELLDTCNEVIRNLKSLKFEFNDFVDLILVYLIQAKLDDSLRKQWELSLDKDSFPTYDMFVQFLEKQARSLQGCSNEPNIKGEVKFNSKPDFKSQRFQRGSITNAVITNSIDRSEGIFCPNCNESHLLHKCPGFQKLNVDQRWNIVKTKKLCNNCLRANHFVAKCLIGTNCKHCHLRHHTFLHSEEGSKTRDKSRISEGVVNSNQGNNSNQNSAVSTCLTNQTYNGQSHTLLATAIIRVKSRWGEFVPCRALIDNASQNSQITKACSKRLDLPMRSTNYQIFGTNNLVAGTAHQELSLEFSPYFSNDTFQTDALLVNQITTNLPNFYIRGSQWPHIEGLTLADPDFNVSRPVDILLAADLFANIIIGESILGPKGAPNAVNSKLGWILTGKIHSVNFNQPISVSCHSISQIGVELQKFWELESIPNSASDSNLDDLYSFSRTKSGRYVVDMPFKAKPNIGNSETLALKCFNSLEIKFKKNPLFKAQYCSFMREYLDLNHMEIVPPSELMVSDHFYLPHHGVIKEDSTTTKLRVVYNASALGTEGHSLNEYLEIGPKLQPDIFKLLLKFRSYPIAFTADIEKMFRQILINPSQTDYQRIFWRFDSNQPISTYRLLTVTYGTSCAPYLAIRTLHQLAFDNQDKFPEIAQIIRNDIYVDDLLSGAHNQDSAKRLINEINQVMRSGGFTLRKWTCNIPEVTAHLPTELLSMSTDKNIHHQEEKVKILGLEWNAEKDILQIQINDFERVKTKRELLSRIASIFDPLGFLSPTTIILKILLQELWRQGTHWDDQVPHAILTSWNELQSQLHLLKSIEIPRFFHSRQHERDQVQLFGFCDGSTKAYAAVAYIRILTFSGEVSINQLASKTRVTPLKTQTLPRIELCAAHLLAKLCATILESLSVQFDDIFLYSDSKIVLAWLKSPPLKGNQFVLNRVNQIHNLIPSGHWHHVSGQLNPADCASRGILPQKLLQHKLWWQGPPFLTEANIPSESETLTDLEDLKDLMCSENDPGCKDSISMTAINNDLFINHLCKISNNYLTIVRILCFIFRFIHNVRHPDRKRTGSLTGEELTSSEVFLFKYVQNYEFTCEISNLMNGKIIHKNSKLANLNCFIDKEGLLRVGGRLCNSDLSDDQKFPIVLPSKHPFTLMILKYYHLKFFHLGAQALLYNVRQKFWPLNGRNLCRKIVHECLTCFKSRPKFATQIMGNLPKERVTPNYAFQVCGVDYCGPFHVRFGRQRKGVFNKIYVAIFVCMSTKAIHLDFVSDLTTQALIACLKRFFSRRGKVSKIFSDNAKNFIGANRELKKLHAMFINPDDTLADFLSTENIDWKFIPPKSPNFGGLWEAGVKSFKYHLKRVMGSSNLTLEEFLTIISEIEAVLNSRPLTPLSSDFDDFETLSPGHFLIGRPLTSISEPPLIDINENRLTKWQRVTKLGQRIWKIWKRDYLNLQERHKWQFQKNEIKICSLVLIKNENLPSTKWLTGRIDELFYGSDKIIRVANIRLANGKIFKRSVRDLCPLPLE